MSSNSVFKSKTHMDHVTDGSTCWCKKRVSVTLNGKKVGDATVDQAGMLNVLINSDEVAMMLSRGAMESISFNPKYKEPEVSVVQTTSKF